MEEESSSVRQDKRTKAAADRLSEMTSSVAIPKSQPSPKRRRLIRQAFSSTLGSLSQDINEAADTMDGTETQQEVLSTPQEPPSPDDQDHQTLTEMFSIPSKSPSTGVNVTKEVVQDEQSH